MSIQCWRRAVTVADLPPRYRPVDWNPAADDGSPMDTARLSAGDAACWRPALEALALELPGNEAAA
jgi:hypothetical protein